MSELEDEINDIAEYLDDVHNSAQSLQYTLRKPSVRAEFAKEFISSLPQALARLTGTAVAVHKMTFTKDCEKVSFIYYNAVTMQDNQAITVSLSDLVETME